VSESDEEKEINFRVSNPGHQLAVSHFIDRIFLFRTLYAMNNFNFAFPSGNVFYGHLILSNHSTAYYYCREFHTCILLAWSWKGSC
jgi:hypothetical protein